jgi:hypothetical protein
MLLDHAAMAAILALTIAGTGHSAKVLLPASANAFSNGNSDQHSSR